MKQRLFQFTLVLSLINFLVAASLGMLLRLHPVAQIEGFIPRFVVHAHSHVAFLGWVFLVLIAFIYKYWLPDDRKTARRFLILVVIFQVAVLGMLFTFPFTGYALWSIIFSTIHMVASLYFIYFFETKSGSLMPSAKKFIRSGLYFMAVSSIGPLALGPLAASGHKFDMWYNLSIYFYLHFQYDGWFTMAIFGLVLARLSDFTLNKYANKITRAFYFFVVGIILTYALSALGYQLSLWVNVIGGIGAVFQLWGFYSLIGVLRKAVRSEFNKTLRKILTMVLVILALKLCAQFLSTLPAIVELTYYNRDLLIAYLHWTLLGFVSLFLVYVIFRELSMWKQRQNYWPAWVFFFAFLVMEILLVFRALALPALTAQHIFYSNVLLLADAGALVVSILGMIIANLSWREHPERY